MIFYYKTLIVLSLPFIFILLFFLFWVCYKLYYKEKWTFVLERFCITCVLIFLFFMFSIINTCSQFLDCSEINGTNYITNYLNENCSNSKYILWKFGWIIPIFLIFSTIIPGLLLYFMVINRKKLFTENNLYKIGYMLNGYDTESFYW